MGTWNEENWSWNLTWRKPWFEWEKNEVYEFHALLEKTIIRREVFDSWEWVINASNMFSIGQFYIHGTP